MMDKTLVIILQLVCWLHCATCDSDVVQGGGLISERFTDSNWTEMLKGEWLVKFYAPWCPACRHLESTWDSLAEWSADRGFRVAKVDVTQESGLSGRFIITSLPTVYHVKNGEFRQYSGSRTFDELQALINDEKWKDIEPISNWKSPSSTMMSCISKLFEVSMQLKDLHTSLTDAYGIPVWASFVIFGVVIIVFGLVLGMGMVFLSDYIFDPSTPPTYSTMDEVKEKHEQNETASAEEQQENVSDVDTKQESIIQDEGEQRHDVRKRVTKSQSAE